MKHYFCQICNGSDDHAHECRTPYCPRAGQPLSEHEADDMAEHERAFAEFQEKHKHEGSK